MSSGKCKGDLAIFVLSLCMCFFFWYSLPKCIKIIFYILNLNPVAQSLFSRLDRIQNHLQGLVMEDLLSSLFTPQMHCYHSITISGANVQFSFNLSSMCCILSGLWLLLVFIPFLRHPVLLSIHASSSDKLLTAFLYQYAPWALKFTSPPSFQGILALSFPDSQ